MVGKPIQIFLVCHISKLQTLPLINSTLSRSASNLESTESDYATAKNVQENNSVKYGPKKEGSVIDDFANKKYENHYNGGTGTMQKTPHFIYHLQHIENAFETQLASLVALQLKRRHFQVNAVYPKLISIPWVELKANRI